MAKLYFRYGTVGSAKTLNLLAVAHNYEQQGKKALLLKPAVDQRFGLQAVKSRAGLTRDADLLLSPDSVISPESLNGVRCILVDEAQFLSRALVEQLRDIATSRSIPVICYGLRSDFRSSLFEGSRRLMELADSIEEIKTTCHFCNKKATQNLKHCDGQPSLDGPAVDLGAEEKYFPVCFGCYTAQLRSADKPSSELQVAGNLT